MVETAEELTQRIHANHSRDITRNEIKAHDAARKEAGL